MLRKSLIGPFGFYLLLSSISLLILPWISISRIQGESGAAVYALLLRVLISLCFTWGAVTARSLFPRTLFQLYILIILFVSLFWGVTNNGITGSERAFFIQTFNLVFAYLAYSFGISVQLVYDSSLLFSFYRKLALPVLIVSAAAAIVSVAIFTAGDSLGRYYSPIYQIGLSAAAFASVNNSLGFLGCALIALVSNKRGSLLMVLVVIAVSVIVRFSGYTRSNNRRMSALNLISFSSFSIILFIFAIVYFKPLAEGAMIALQRIPTFFSLYDGIANLDISGRDIEFNIALADLDSLDKFIVGNGIGWNINIPGRDIPVNAIHFTPLSLMIVYGPLGALVLYLGLLLSATRALCLGFTTPGTMVNSDILFAASYILGAVAYSFTAYNIFVDLNIFVFAGVLSKKINFLK